MLFRSPPCPTFASMDCIVHGILQARILEWAAFPFSRVLTGVAFFFFFNALCTLYHLTLNSQRRQWHPTPVLLPKKSHGRRSLVAAVHGVFKSRAQLSDFTFTFHFHALEKNGNPLQCSCLENPRDSGAWWAAIYGVAKSWT